MIPPLVMYVLAAVLGVWGLFRLNMGRKAGAKGRGGHLFFGCLYVLMALYLILTTARVIPPPRFFGGRGAPPAEPQTVQVMPLTKIPRPPQAASQPATAPAAPGPAGVKPAPAKAAPAALGPAGVKPAPAQAAPAAPGPAGVKPAPAKAAPAAPAAPR